VVTLAIGVNRTVIYFFFIYLFIYQFIYLLKPGRLRANCLSQNQVQPSIHSSPGEDFDIPFVALFSNHSASNATAYFSLSVK